MKSILAILLSTASLVSGCAHVSNDSKRHFGELPTACKTESCPIRKDLSDLDNCGVMNLETKCDAADTLLDDLFGGTRQYKFAHYIIYLEQTAPGVTFKDHPPILVWNGKKTRYLYGVQEVYILVFTEYKACIGAEVTTVAKNEPNPFDAVLKVLGKGIGSSDSQTPLKFQTAHFAWYPLSGDFDQPVMWLAIGSVPLDINTVNWITVRLNQPKQKSDRTASLPDECVVEPGQPIPSYKVPSLARSAFFSNNRDSRFGVSVAAGLTHSHAGPTGTNGFNVNGYALGKWYPKRFMPALESEPDYRGPGLSNRWSLSIVGGTNVITNTPFTEVLVGVGLGHLWGNVGVITGIDFFTTQPAGTNTNPPSPPSRRHGVPFLGVEYSF